MINPRTAAILGVFLLAICVIGMAAQNSRRKSGTVLKPRAQESQLSPSSGLPDHVFYGEVFSLLVAMENVADYKTEAALSLEQALVLEEIAKRCQKDVAAQDAKAEPVIRAFRERMIKERRKKIVPSTELAALQEERDAIILRYRDRLRSALGEEKFEAFKQTAKKLVHISVSQPQ